jgi:hypothetical protein
MKIIFVIIAVLGLTACEKNQHNIEKSIEPTKKTLPISSNLSSVTTFFGENDVLKQNLNVTWVASGRIDFSYLITDKKSRLERKLNGIALSLNSDPEIDEDEDGDAYPAIEYRYKDGNCQFSIRIDMESKSRARTKSGGCAQGLSLESVAILKKKDV